MFSDLKLRQFRNYLAEDFKFHSKTNIFVGQNGQGKTNILEALHLLSSGSSFRFSENSHFAKFGSKESFVQAHASIQNLKFDFVFRTSDNRKELLLNAKRITSPRLLELLYPVVFSPESLSVIKDSADSRRKLVDQVLVTSSPEQMRLVQDFKKIYLVRNRILKDHVETQNHQRTEMLLNSIQENYFKKAIQVTQSRIHLLRELHPWLLEAAQHILKSKVQVDFQYLASGQNLIHSSHEDIHKHIMTRANELRMAELQSGANLVGPHKHDIVILFNQNDSRFYASQGQQRALILAFKMAQIVYHSKVHSASPILLLDDVLSELDDLKRGALIEFLQSVKAQIFLTTTDLQLTGDLGAKDCQVTEVFNGRIVT